MAGRVGELDRHAPVGAAAEAELLALLGERLRDARGGVQLALHLGRRALERRPRRASTPCARLARAVRRARASVAPKRLVRLAAACHGMQA